MKPRADLLVVDDEQVVRGAVRRVCQAEGLTVNEAETVDGGLKELVSGIYRIVLLDLMLPAGGGMRVLDAVREDHPETPVVMITGYATPRRKIECIHAGAFDVLPKPFDANELVAVLRRALAFDTSAGGVVASRELGDVFALGRHAWVRIEKEGTAAAGIGTSFHPILEGLTGVETPGVDDELVQGKRMAMVTSRDGMVHRVWSPLSGRILEAKNTWTWGRSLLRIVPTDLERELERLTRI
jgi:CheY-like chemotaxis protein